MPSCRVHWTSTPASKMLKNKLFGKTGIQVPQIAFSEEQILNCFLHSQYKITKGAQYYFKLIILKLLDTNVFTASLLNIFDILISTIWT